MDPISIGGLAVPMLAVVVLILSVVGYFFIFKDKTKKGSGMWKQLSALGIVVSIIWIVIATPNLFAATGPTEKAQCPSGQSWDATKEMCVKADVNGKTLYSIDLAADASTYVFATADAVNTDEAAGNAEITINDASKTISMTNTCDYSAETNGSNTGCTWDVISVVASITRQDSGDWSGGARVTSNLRQKIGDWSPHEYWSNASGNPMVPLVPVNGTATGVKVFQLTDGAGLAGAALGASDATIAEFSPSETQSSAGAYVVINEHALSLNVPQGTYSTTNTLTFYDDYGFSLTYTIVISFIMQE